MQPSRPFIIGSFLIATAATAAAGTVNVPSDQPTIQAGIDAAKAGDTVEVAAGKYVENVVVNTRTDVTLHAAGVVTIAPKGAGAAVLIAGSQRITFDGFTVSKSRADGIAISNSAFVSILHCTVAKSKQNGILAVGSDDLTIADCVVTKTGKDLEGISVSFGDVALSARCHVRRCTVSKAGGEGIDVHGASSVIEDCTVTNPKNDGIELDRGGGTDNGIVRRCKVVSAGDVGIVVSGTGGLVEDNTVTGAYYFGISILQDFQNATTNTIVRRNTINGTKRYEGIHLNAPSCTLDVNTVSKTHGDGITVQKTGNTLTGNVVTKARGYGVALGGSGHTVTGNSATGSKKADLLDESTGSVLSGNTFPKVK